jgi:preprotein translocase subunit SecG
VFVLTGIVVFIAVLSAVGLVFLVLMHSGRGGGISDLLGGSLGSVAQGSTVVERNLDRFTVAVAIVFFFAVLTLDLRLQ